MTTAPSIDRRLIAPRYRNEGTPLRKLNELQRRTIASFISDSRIKFKPVLSCVLCGHGEFTIIAEKDQFGIPLDTALCQRCGLVFSLNQFDNASAQIFYSEYYRKIYEGVAGPTLGHGYYKKLFAGSTLVPKIPRFISKESTVLEIGCGGGWNLLPYKNANIRHFGFDYDRDMVSFGSSEFGLNIFEGDVETARKMNVKADFVILSHVLEHVGDPVSFLEGIASVMNDGSIIRITVPSLDCLRYFGGSGIGFDFGSALQNAHNFTFSESTLTMILRKSGFVPIVSVHGFCLAKLAKNDPSAALNWGAGTGGALAAFDLIRSSERLLPYKAAILRLTPVRLRFALTYINLLFRPLSVLHYFSVFNKRSI